MPISRRVRYDGRRLDSVDFSSDFVTPVALWAEEPRGDGITNTSSAQFARALSIAAGGDNHRALSLFQELANTRQDPGVELDMALCLWNVGERRRALAVLDEVRLRYPDYWPAVYNEAVLCLLGGQNESAHAFAQQLQHLVPGHPAYIRLASALVSRLGA